MYRTLLLLAVLLAGCARAEAQPDIRNDLDGLIEASDLIVIATVQGETGTRNLARDGSDPTREDPVRLVLGVDYRLRIESVLKGNAGDTAVISIPKAHGVRGIPTIASDTDFVPLTTGSRYLLFLRALSDRSGAYGAAPEPYRFVLEAQARPESRWASAAKYFPPRPTETLIAEVKAAIR